MTRFRLNSVFCFLLIALVTILGIQATSHSRLYSGPTTIVVEDEIAMRMRQDSLIPAKVLNDTINSRFDDIRIIRRTKNQFDKVTVTVYKSNGVQLGNPQTQTLTPVVHQDIVDYPITITIPNEVPNNLYAYKFKCVYHAPVGNHRQIVFRYVRIRD
jgi:hypothetical protein